MKEIFFARVMKLLQADPYISRRLERDQVFKRNDYTVVYRFKCHHYRSANEESIRFAHLITQSTGLQTSPSYYRRDRIRGRRRQTGWWGEVAITAPNSPRPAGLQVDIFDEEESHNQRGRAVMRLGRIVFGYCTLVEMENVEGESESETEEQEGTHQKLFQPFVFDMPVGEPLSFTQAVFTMREAVESIYEKVNKANKIEVDMQKASSQPLIENEVINEV